MTHPPRPCSKVEVLEDPTLCGLFTRKLLPVRTKAERVQCLRGCARHTNERGVKESSGEVEAGEASHRIAIGDGLQVDVYPPYEQDSRVRVQIKYCNKYPYHSVFVAI